MLLQAARPPHHVGHGLNVVINHSGGPCTGRFSCSSAVPAILPQGSSMTVWFRGAAGSMQSVTLHGRARG
ncbi:DddA-like double-stranded DNA deaminase toxin [Streptomyces sp. AC04842]|uniref:DddA-like double-stranded DNA deaminase toxin n=1 Tax=unclassified Streptomyces TaxID=2593676 RepID=UPI0033569472